MLEKFIIFGQRLVDNLDMIVLGIILTIISRVIITKSINKKNNKENNKNNVRMFEELLTPFGELLIPFISIFLILAIFLIIKSWNGKDITDGNVLSAIVSFISPFIAFTGAYALAEYNHRINEENRKEEERKNIEKIKNEKKEEELYAKDMLYSLLEYTVKKTEYPIKLIHAKCVCRRASREDLDIKNAYKETVELERECFRNELIDALLRDTELKKNIREYLISENIDILVYDKEWTKYMKFIIHDYREPIISWLNLLNSKEVDFVIMPPSRDEIIAIINEYRNCRNNLKVLDQILEENMKYYH